MYDFFKTSRNVIYSVITMNDVNRSRLRRLQLEIRTEMPHNERVKKTPQKFSEQTSVITSKFCLEFFCSLTRNLG